MSSNCPTTCDTFVRTILKAISSSPIISNLFPTASDGLISNRRSGVTSQSGDDVRDSLVLVLIFEGFVDALCDGFAVEDEAFGDWRLQLMGTMRESLISANSF